ASRVHGDAIWKTARIRAERHLGTPGTSDEMLTPDADHTASSEIPPTVVVPTRQGGLVVNVRFDRTSVWRSGLVIMGLVAGLLLFLWLFSMLSHFLFLVLLAWLL